MTLIFFFGGGGVKRWDGKLCVPTEKSWLRPWFGAVNDQNDVNTARISGKQAFSLMFSALVVLKHIHKVTEKLIFSRPFGYCDIERPRLSELLHTAQKDGNFNDTKAKRIENPLKYKSFGFQHVKSSLVLQSSCEKLVCSPPCVSFDNLACSNSFTCTLQRRPSGK